MKKLFDLSSRSVNMTILLVIALTSLTATIVEEALFLDGTRWLSDIIYTQHFVVDYPHFRLATLLFQLPSVLTAKIFPTSLELIRKMFSLSYCFMPFTFMLATFLYLRRLKKEEYFVIFGLAYFAFVFPATFFPVNVAMEGVMAFFILIIAEAFDHNTLRKTAIRLCGGIFLLWSYEAAIGLFILLFIICAIKHPQKFMSLGICTYILFILIKLAINIYVMNKYTFFNIMPGEVLKESFVFGRFRITFLSIIIFTLFPISFLTRKRREYIILGCLLLFTMQIYLLFKNEEGGRYFFNSAFLFRHLVTPFAGVFIFLSIYLFALKDKKYFDIFCPYALIFCPYALFASSYAARDWHHSISAFKQVISQKKGCFPIPPTHDAQANAINDNYFFAQMSLLFPTKGRIKALAMPENNRAMKFFNVCDSFDEAHYRYSIRYNWGAQAWHLNLTPAIEEYLNFTPRRKVIELKEHEHDCDHIRYLSFSEDPIKFTTKGLSPGYYQVHIGVSGIQEVDFKNKIKLIIDDQEQMLFSLDRYKDIYFNIRVKQSSSSIILRQEAPMRFQNIYEETDSYFGVNCFYTEKL